MPWAINLSGIGDSVEEEASSVQSLLKGFVQSLLNAGHTVTFVDLGTDHADYRTDYFLPSSSVKEDKDRQAP